jgi:hypothetical protein
MTVESDIGFNRKARTLNIPDLLSDFSFSNVDLTFRVIVGASLLLAAIRANYGMIARILLIGLAVVALTGI